MDFCCIDVETTGLNPAVDKVVEIAMVDGRGSKSSLIYPGDGVRIPPEAVAVHHITEEMLVDAPALDDFLAYLDVHEDIVCVAHKAAFDSSFLPQLNQNIWIDTLRCAKHLFPDAPSFGNQVLRYFLNLRVSLPEGMAPHRAEYDAIVTYALMKRMLQERSLEELVTLTKTPILLQKVQFGKHKGQQWSTVPHSYLRWYLSNEDKDEDVAFTCEHYLS